MKFWISSALLLVALVQCHAEQIVANICSRPAPGSVVAEPADLRSKNGFLKVELNYYEVTEANAHTRFCFQTEDGAQSPNPASSRAMSWYSS